MLRKARKVNYIKCSVTTKKPEGEGKKYKVTKNK